MLSHRLLTVFVCPSNLTSRGVDPWQALPGDRPTPPACAARHATAPDRDRSGAGLAFPLLLAVLLGTVIVPNASGQDTGAPPATRGALLTDERDEKAANVTPPKRSLVERTLYRYDNQSSLIFGTWRGFHLAGTDFPAGAGMKFGVGFNHVFGSSYADQPNRLELATVAARGLRGYTRGVVG